MPAGSWVEFNGASHNGVVAPIPANMTECLCHGESTGQVLPYANEAVWNPVLKGIEIVGRDHGGTAVPFTVAGVTYSDNNGPDYNKQMYHYRCTDDARCNVATVTPSPGHAYDHYQVNPHNGDLYMATYGEWTPLYRLPAGSKTWQKVAGSPDLYGNITYSLCWWDGPWKGKVYPQGLLMIWDNQWDEMAVFDPATSTYLPKVKTPTYAVSSGDYQGVMSYSKLKNCAIFGGKGGSAGNRRVMRLNADGTCTELNQMPAQWGIGYMQMACEPVSGNFLMNFSDAIYVYNPDGSGSRSVLPAGRPARVYPGGGQMRTVLCTIEEYGVVAFITAESFGPAYLHFYKHK